MLDNDNSLREEMDELMNDDIDDQLRRQASDLDNRNLLTVQNELAFLKHPTIDTSRNEERYQVKVPERVQKLAQEWATELGVEDEAENVPWTQEPHFI